MAAELIHGCCLQEMAAMKAAGRTFDSIVTDPPAGIAFMGAHWDRDRGGRDHWIAWMQQVAAAALLVAKPGAHALVWALPRTSHWTATAWENAGWEVRDRLSHLFGSGFPKSLNVSAAIDKAAGAERQVIGPKVYADGTTGHFSDAAVYGAVRDGVTKMETAPATPEAQRWDGFGTALKPAMEDWWLLRKPLIGTVAQNVLAHGTGALNIDACRVGTDENQSRPRGTFPHSDDAWGNGRPDEVSESHPAGRWPANILHDGSPEVLAAFARFGVRQARGGDPKSGSGKRARVYGAYGGGHEMAVRNDTGSAARYFPALGFSDDELRFAYCAKASRRERGEGNTHSTVKPLALIRWLTKLITPPGGTVLDCFAGSGTTGLACLREGFDCVLIEREAEYVAMCAKRLGLTFELEAAD